MLYKEIIHMINDELKQESNDSYFTLDHIIFLCNKYRSRIMKTLYDTRIYHTIGDKAVQTISMDLIRNSENKYSNVLLKTSTVLPQVLLEDTLSINAPDLYSSIYISIISPERMKFTGVSKWERNIVYCSLHPDGHLYFKSADSQFLALKKINVTAVFSDCDEVVKINNPNDDIMNMIYPIEDYLVPQLVLLVVKELTGAMYTPQDNINNGEDDKSNLQNVIRANMKKSKQQKKIEEDEDGDNTD